MNRLVWCAEIRTGISLVDPNDNLASAYFKKAENALEAMHSVHPKEWKISTGYYSLYFSLYAVLMNELSMIFARLGIDTEEVLRAAGTKWNFHQYRPGLVGGHCIPVDPYYLVKKAKEVGYHPQVILAGWSINDSMPRYLEQELLFLFE